MTKSAAVLTYLVFAFVLALVFPLGGALLMIAVAWWWLTSRA